jgi:hypothetical protein
MLQFGPEIRVMAVTYCRSLLLSVSVNVKCRRPGSGTVLVAENYNVSGSRNRPSVPFVVMHVPLDFHDPIRAAYQSSGDEN